MPEYWILEDRKPKPAGGVLAWGRWLEDFPNERVLAQDELGGGVFVSTIFLGLDHRFGDAGPPLLFETMIFGGRRRDEQYQVRSSTWDQAMADHDRALKLAWRKNLGRILWGRIRGQRPARKRAP